MEPSRFDLVTKVARYTLGPDHPLCLSAARIVGGGMFIPPGVELTLETAIHLRAACGLVELDGWPELECPDSADPSGLALYPPANGAPVVAGVREGVRDAMGQLLPYSRVAVGSVFRVHGRAVVRGWAPTPKGHSAPVTLRLSDITGQQAIWTGPKGKRVKLPEEMAGWAVGRADPPPSSGGPMLAS